MARACYRFTIVTVSGCFLLGCANAGRPSPEPTQATPASFSSNNNIPSTRPTIGIAPPTTAPSALAEQFDASLLALLNNQSSVQASTSLAPDERQLIDSVITSLARFRTALRDTSDNTMAARVAPLMELSERIHAQSALNVPTLALCKSVTQFGAYDEFENARFPAGKETPTIVYCEIENFSSRQADPGRWETKLSYEAALYTNDSSNSSSARAPVLSKKPTIVTDECRNRRRDFFLADRFTIPSNLPVGQYLLKVTVIDELANHVAEKTVPITISSD